MKNIGHICLSRILETEPFKSYSAKQLRFFIYLLFRLRWQEEPQVIFLGTKEFLIEKGWYAVTHRKLVEEYNKTCSHSEDKIPKTTMGRFLRGLKVDHALDHETISHMDHEITIIKPLHPEICKFYKKSSGPGKEKVDGPRFGRKVDHDPLEKSSLITNNDKEVSFVKKETKKKDVVVSVSFSDSKEEEFIEGISVYCNSKGMILNPVVVKRWLKKFGEDLINQQISALLRKTTPTKNPEAWMETALAATKNLSLNKLYAEEFKTEHNWFLLTILKQYCRDESTQNDYQFKLPHEEFKRLLKEKFEQQQGIV